MRLLVLGGSWFVGRHLVTAAVDAGHQVSVFNRGRTPAIYPTGVQVIHGDRSDPDDLARLARHAVHDGDWDAVLDVPETPPRLVEAATRALVAVADRYLFVSSVSAYRDWPAEPVTEASPLHAWDPARPPSVEDYGPMKAVGEHHVRAAFGPERALVLRPGVVLGPGEYVGRVPWWLARMRRDGEVLAPAPPERGIQPVDVRDLAAFAVARLEHGAGGTWNIAAPRDAATFETLLQACADAEGARPAITWVGEQFLLEHGVRQWTQLPLWRTAPGTWAVDVAHARSDGLTCRPLQQTVRAVHAWLTAGDRPVPNERWDEHGIAPGLERRILAAWKARGATPSDQPRGS